MAAQQAVGKAVNGAHVGRVEPSECIVQASAALAGKIGLAQLREQSFADAEPQLASSPARECDRGDPLDLEGRAVVRRCQHVHEARYDQRGLARAGAGIDDHVP